MFAPSQLPSATGAHADPLDHARSAILAPAALDENRVASILGEVMGHAVDYADVYFQAVREESWTLEDGIVKDGAHSIEQGVGVRAIAGEKTGFAYSDEIVLPALLEAARAARAIARSGATGALQAWHATGGHEPVSARSIRSTRSTTRDKVRLLRGARPRGARARPARHAGDGEPRRASHEIVLVLASDGTLAADVRPLVRLNVSVIVEHERAPRAGLCGRRRPLFATPSSSPASAGARWCARPCARRSVNLEAVPAPAGTMTVVLGPGWPGVLLHEAIGHGLEGDFNRKGTSAFTRPHRRARRGAGRARSSTTARCRGRRGSLNIDDEGTPTQCTTLIENGVLKRLPAGQAQRAADGRRSRPATAAASRSRT